VGGHRTPTRLVAVAKSRDEADRAVTEGADLIEFPAHRLAEPPPLDADLLAAGLLDAGLLDAGLLAAEAGAGVPAMGAGPPGSDAGPPGSDAGPPAVGSGPPPAAVVAVAAIATWLGAPAIRTRQVRAVRRAIDMTSAIAGTRLPAQTTRGLA
jgi:hypothetical protein